MPIINRIADFHADMTAWRRDLHQHPELSYEEHWTSDFVAKQLESFGVEVHRGLAVTGVVGKLVGRSDSGKAIGLRADMDALPILEANDVAYKSLNPGKMHACGHDGHTTMLLGAAKYLAETRNFDGTVYFIFQPAEEGGAGGDRMVKEGLFEKFPVETVWGMHNIPGMAVGEFAIKAGPMMAGTSSFDITIHGRGGHAAMPYQTIDPILIASEVVGALQSIASRSSHPLDSLVVSVTQIHGGDAYNVIPPSVKLCGTVRTYRDEVTDLAEARMKQVVDGVAAAHGGRGEVDFRRGYPATVNHEAETEIAAKVAVELVGADKVDRNPTPSMGGEDFAYMLNAKPGSYIWLGAGEASAGAMLHNPGYDFNDEVLPLGASYWSKLVEAELPRAEG
ncbi:M20 aminoacylase family protein [Thalassobaculum sp.]|uniref:M20 aminoacylase family protein n=1 Tax=Thalassobaculum sp. TaxID=2022740 RepID=UPI0032EB0BA1